MAVQRACAEAIRTGDSANACASSCPAAPADTDARWLHDGAEFPWGTAGAGLDEQDLRARRSGRDAGTAAIDAMWPGLERRAARSEDSTRQTCDHVPGHGRRGQESGVGKKGGYIG